DAAPRQAGGNGVAARIQLAVAERNGVVAAPARAVHGDTTRRFGGQPRQGGGYVAGSGHGRIIAEHAPGTWTEAVHWPTIAPAARRAALLRGRSSWWNQVSARACGRPASRLGAARSSTASSANCAAATSTTRRWPATWCRTIVSSTPS